MPNEGDDVKVERAAIAAIVIGALAIGAILVFGPRNAPARGVHPAALVRSITPDEYPYSSLAILRSPRTTEDVLPSDVGAFADALIPDSVHHLLTSTHEDTWIAASAAGGFCLLFTTPGVAGGGSACSLPGPTPKPGTALMGSGSGLVSLRVVTDGQPKAGQISPGYRQIAPNIWMKGRATVVRHPEQDGDPLAFPRVQPFRSFAILRRPRTAADAAPAAMTEATTGVLASYRQDQVRLGGTYDGVKAYVTINAKGDVCLLVSGRGLSGSGCRRSKDLVPGTSAAVIGVQGTDGKSVLMVLRTDGRLSATDALGLTKLGPNVYEARSD